MRIPNLRHLTRREFGTAAAAAAGLSLLPTVGLANEPKPEEKSAQPQTKPAQPAPEPPSPEAVALAGIVKLRYGSRLDDAALQDITHSLESGLKTGATLRKFDLANSDEPASLFRALRGEHD
jgi:hypothetical protein